MKEQLNNFDIKSSNSYGDKLEELPVGANQRNNLTWRIGLPSFIKKEKQRVFWATRIKVECITYEYRYEPSVNLGTYGSYGTQDIGPTGPILSDYTIESMGPTGPAGPTGPSVDDWMLGQSGVSGTISGPGGVVPSGPVSTPGSWLPMKRLKIQTSGETVFEVLWSVVITTKGKFTSPKIEEIDYVETIWR